ncbi:DUF5977 domain-containing protein [Pedobacter cryoconitis]|uniref:DUF5977 domain-containing protein n=1 Tax=Pedobacter cryoconitis TaxID=188932 RepID=UPI00162250DC|nr:DUF5977 domain-containing protein [Pedobacter cryoconitis]MBB5643896.1 hypothetical protein [Pedobacter cryoconitis]
MRKIYLLLLLTVLCLTGYTQTLTGPSVSYTGSTIELTISGETATSHCLNYPLFNPTETTTASPFESIGTSANPSYVQGTNLWNASTKNPTKLTMTVHNGFSYPITATYYFTVKIIDDNTGRSYDTRQQFTLTINPPIHPPTTYFSSEKTGVFYKNNCGPGYTSEPFTYTIPARKWAGYSQAEADAKALNDLNTTGQSEANINRTCISTCTSAPGEIYQHVFNYKFWPLQSSRQQVNVQVNNLPDVSYYWYVDGVLRRVGDYSFSIYWDCSEKHVIEVEAVNPCGKSNRLTFVKPAKCR